MERSLKQNLFYFFPILFSFCLPFGSYVLSWIIVAWTFTGFFNLDYSRIKSALRRIDLWACYLFFLITLLSAYLSENVSEALFSIEVKLSFLLFPFLLFCFNWPVAIIKRCVMGFVSGCFFATLFLVCRGLFYFLQGKPEYLFYNEFSIFIHTSYFSMYLNLAIAFVFVLYPAWFATQKAVLRSAYVFACVFVIAIFLCSSKLGLMSFMLNSLFIFFYRFRASLSLKGSAFIAFVLLVLSVVFYFIFPAPFERLVALVNFDTEHVDKNAIESTAVRVLIWEQSMELIRQNFFFGTGVGDANAELYKAYERNGLTGAFSYKLNAHNQYLQTFIGMGIFSFLLLLFLTLGAMIRALITKQFLLFVFAFLVTFNFLVESMLQRAAGVVFFCFFYCFLSLVKEEHFMLDEKEVV